VNTIDVVAEISDTLALFNGLGLVSFMLLVITRLGLTQKATVKGKWFQCCILSKIASQKTLVKRRQSLIYEDILLDK
jgi:hypothetical protein